MKMFDSVLITVPLSSPLHPTANLVFLKSFILQNGFNMKTFDTNILFFNWMLRKYDFNFKFKKYKENPIELLNLYNQIEKWLSIESNKYEGFRIDLRTVALKYNRVRFSEVLRALDDKSANPFIFFYNEFLSQFIISHKPKFICIGITFQDHIIAAFTLADRIRKLLPETKIILGGQMITRCRDTLKDTQDLAHLWDYLICWDGEWPLYKLHKYLLNGEKSERLVNIISKEDNYLLDRHAEAFDLDLTENLIFDDINFDDYYFPEAFVPLQTARGCYGKCEFCAIPMGSNTGFRERAVEKIIQDLISVQEHTQKKYGRKATYFKFMDDTSSPRTLLGIAKEIEKRDLNVKWETYVRMEKQFQSEDIMKQLYRGGCRKLMWGLETNDPEILKSMSKKVSPVSVTKVLNSASDAGILNFVFVLLGFPGETDEQREALQEFIINKDSIHVLTLATFDITKGSRMEHYDSLPVNLKIEIEPAKDFEVRLPYIIDKKNWKEFIVKKAHKFILKVSEQRPDIGLVSLFPDQVRSCMTDIHGNMWGKKYLVKFGKEKIKNLLLATKQYSTVFSQDGEIELACLPDPLKREHLRTKEDILAIEKAIKRRREYEIRRSDSI